MGRLCAYCQKDKKLTKEHIWQKCIIKRMPELELKFLDSRKLVTNSELVITDVCSDCNNNKLSPLDSYFCELYDKYFFKYIEDKSNLKFKYNYNLLLRSLLKITYNSSRTKSRINNDFTKYKDFILTGNENREDVIVKIDIITPSIINNKIIYPKSARCGTIKIGVKSENFILRMISVNSYYFYMIISKEVDIKSEIIRNEFFEIFNSVPGTVIEPGKEEIELKGFSNRDTLYIHKPHIDTNKEFYDRAIKNNKK